MPEESQTLPSEREPELPMEVVEASVASASGDFEGEAQNSSEVLPSMPVIIDDDCPLTSRLLNFSVHYRENILPLEVPDSETVGKNHWLDLLNKRLFFHRTACFFFLIQSG